jgi:hypothetical protein
MSWTYRKKLTITGTSAGSQTNYQLKLHIYKGSGSDSGLTVYCEGHCADDFSDLRFTKSDGLSELDYWIESYTSGTDAYVWVEFDSTPDNGVTMDFYLYYNTSSLSKTTNGENTFPFFDDFPGSSIDTSKWGSGTASATVSGSILDLYHASWADILGKVGAVSATCAARAYIKLGGNYSEFRIDSTDGNGIHAGISASGVYAKLSSNDGTYSDVSSNWEINAYHWIDIIIRGGVNSRFLQDGVERDYSPKTNNPPNQAGLFIELGSGGQHVFCGVVFLRNYTFDEPTITSWTGEEDNTVNTDVSSAIVLGTSIPTPNSDWTGTVSVPISITLLASQFFGAIRNAAVLLGNLIVASRIADIISSSSVMIGVTSVMSRVLDSIRNSDVMVGLTTLASKILEAVRSMSVLVGNLISASGIKGAIATASVLIGDLVSATKSYGSICTSSVIVGVLSVSSRILDSTRSSIVIIGKLVSASRIIGYIRKFGTRTSHRWD